MINYTILLIFTFITILLRVLGVDSNAYQAFAHLFVGGLLGAWYVGRDKLILYIAILLSFVEVACAILLR